MSTDTYQVRQLAPHVGLNVLALGLNVHWWSVPEATMLLLRSGDDVWEVKYVAYSVHRSGIYVEVTPPAGMTASEFGELVGSRSSNIHLEVRR